VHKSKVSIKSPILDGWMSVLNNIKRQYRTVGGYSEFLKIAIPLVVSTGIEAVQLFTDRVFLSWYSQNSFVASAPAGIANWAIVCFFFGTLAYIDVFVAQYYGRREYKLIGSIIWQSVYLAIIASFIIFCISFLAEPFFMNVGHPYAVACEEVRFFKILCYGAFPCIAEAVLAGFYAGRGKTKIVLLVSFCGVVLNIVLDFCLIFGNFGLPEMGIVGAGLASNISLTVVCIIYVLLIISKKNNNIYNTRCITPNFAFMKKMLRYGLPSGAELFFDTSGFGIFMIIIGNLGIDGLAASNIVATVRHVFSMIIVGCGMTTSIMVGNYLGKNKTYLAQASVRSALHIVYLYIVFVILGLIFLPSQFIYTFSSGEQVILIERIRPMVVNLLRILGVYLIFDAGSIIFASAIKGAGDTVFVMKKFLFFSIFLVVIPTYFNIIILKCGVYVAWGSLLLYVIALSTSFYFRYKSKKWEKIRITGMDAIND
jgi:MATE family multidrug resistance protein